jgi:lipoprotein-releasing system permease protein
MPADQIILWIIVALAPVATIFALWRILKGPRIISKLMIRYLMKRRIAWVSLIAVMLCTAMVLIVISVMGGWLRMFRQTNHDLIGDLIIYRGSLDGFSHYEDMIADINKVPEIDAVTPTIRTGGLAEIGTAEMMTDPIHAMVEVVGVDIKQIGRVNGFVRSLHLQKDVLLAKADDFTHDAAQKRQDAATRAASDVPIDQFEAGQMQDDAQEDLAMVDSFRAKAADFPSFDKPLPDSVYRDQGFKGNPTKWGGIIVGSGVIGLRAHDERADNIYKARVKLTLVKVNPGDAGPSLGDMTSTNYYWLVDDSHTDVFQVDQGTVYLPFHVLQNQLDMGASTDTNAVTGQQEIVPARCSEILIRVKPGVDPYFVEPKVAAIVDAVTQKFGLDYGGFGQLKVETWDEHQRDFLNAVEHEELLLVILFAIISIVAIFLIFCIFFMIVMEKTRDIGIIKSVGATSSSVAAIFLGYGLSIGLLGGGMGLLLAYLVVHYINQLHAWMAHRFGLEIWNAKTYLFDTIPNTMNGRDVAVIVSVAILSSVLGALVPAIRAARMNPVEALRWE